MEGLVDMVVADVGVGVLSRIRDALDHECDDIITTVKSIQIRNMTGPLVGLFGLEGVCNVSVRVLFWCILHAS